jgi:hypothetical protein
MLLYLWHLIVEEAILSLFDNEADQTTKIKIVTNLTKENILTIG